MINRFLFLLILVYVNVIGFSQPGYILSSLHFKVFYQGRDVTGRIETGFILEWRVAGTQGNNWQKAFIQNSEFVTGGTRSDAGVDVKIYRQGYRDTMFITTPRSLQQVPFQPGRFVLDQHTVPLANMESFAGVQLLNQQWQYFNARKQYELPLLIKQRYVYMSRQQYPYDLDLPAETGVQFKAFHHSMHIKEVDAESYMINVELGQLYYAPWLSPAVYSIGYLNDEGAAEKDYRPYLLESRDGCRTWSVLFAVEETDAQLAGITPGGFVFIRDAAEKSLVTYDVMGRVVNIAAEEDPCLSPVNIFAPCNRDVKFSGVQPIETSGPFMSANSILHLFNRRFTNDGVHFISIGELPFHPDKIYRTALDGTDEKIIQLNSGDTYAYLTMRKNKLVLVTYNYTLVSLDAGNTWTYYRNGLLDSGTWNFIWLDDNTLVNVTQEYADVVLIE